MKTLLVKAFRLAALLMLLALTSACALPDELARRSAVFTTQPKLGDSPRLNSFLNLKDSRAPGVRLEISGLEIMANDLWLPLTQGPLSLDSETIGEGQILLDGVQVMPGLYQRVRMTVTQVRARSAAGAWQTLLAEPRTFELPLADQLNLAAHDSSSLFFSWDVESSLAAERAFTPAFAVAPAIRELPVDLVYASCPDIDTIFVIRADTNRVVDSFGLKGRPTWIAMDRGAGNQRLYVLTPGDRLIKVVDLSSYRTIDFFPVPLNDDPTFMTLGAGAQSAYLLDERSGYLSRVDLASGRIMARAALGFRPQYADYLEARNLLVVSLADTQKVLLLDPASLAVRGSLSTGSRPEGLIVVDNQLYVAEQGDSTVSVFDLDSLANLGRISVGYSPGRLLDTGRQIYVSHEQDGMLAVLVAGQLGVIQEIYGLGRPRDMVFNAFVRSAYVVDRQGGGLSVVDVNANRLLTQIPLGAMPFGLAVTQ